MSSNDNYFHKLVDLMDVLRGPQGCPWDKEQTRETLKPMLVEEAYELLEALDGTDSDELCEELGDVLFQVIFHSRISKEKGEFDIDDVCCRLYEKMVGRHPHVFENQSYQDSRELLRNWEDIKAAEKKASGREVVRGSLLDGIPGQLPALYGAYQISSKAARVGFDWDNVEGIRDKFLEEFEELQVALEKDDQAKIKEEVGDLLFAALNISRYLQIDPESALNQANRKFLRRFKAMEEHFAAQERSLKEVNVEEMEAFWQDQKDEAV
ncbi:nucleoside triphosphate pyrophosphohydrolase [Acidobacteria bacterium AH-259-O06]|nr:nucleoside triphosphate pyrophosphohydrolase [Acidobacteria bacterium AH-259-O06]